MAAGKGQAWLKQETTAIRELANDLATASLLKSRGEVQLLTAILRSRARVIGDLVEYVEYMEYKKQQEE